MLKLSANFVKKKKRKRKKNSQLILNWFKSPSNRMHALFYNNIFCRYKKILDNKANDKRSEKTLITVTTSVFVGYGIVFIALGLFSYKFDLGLFIYQEICFKHDKIQARAKMNGLLLVLMVFLSIVADTRCLLLQKRRKDAKKKFKEIRNQSKEEKVTLIVFIASTIINNDFPFRNQLNIKKAWHFKANLFALVSTSKLSKKFQ